MKHFKFFSLVMLLVVAAPLSASQLTGPDVFCDILSGKAPATIIYEDDDIIAIEKPAIRNPADCLIIPKKHIVNIKDLDQANTYDAVIVSKMVAIAQMLSQRLCDPADFTITMNNGKTSAQTVFHMHMHFKSPQQWKNPDWRTPLRLSTPSGLADFAGLARQSK